MRDRWAKREGEGPAQDTDRGVLYSDTRYPCVPNCALEGYSTYSTWVVLYYSDIQQVAHHSSPFALPDRSIKPSVHAVPTVLLEGYLRRVLPP